jgi:hypothetical protein
VTVLFVAIVSAAFPMHAEQKIASHRQTIVVASNAPESIRLPDFVPVINFDQFLLASRGNDFGSDDDISAETRTAAETLSAKFAGPASGSSSSKFFHAVVQQDPVAPDVFAAEDPKLPAQTAALTDPDSATDPEKIAEAEPAEPVAEAEEPAAEKPVAHLQARAPRRAAVARSRHVKRSYVPRQQRRVATASEMSPRSGSTYNGIGADLQRLVGFGSLTPDNRLTH